DLGRESADRRRRQADVAVRDAARARVEIVALDGQSVEIREHRRIAEPADLQDLRSALEALDVAHASDERILRRVDPDPAGNRDLAGCLRIDRVLDDLVALEVVE